MTKTHAEFLEELKDLCEKKMKFYLGKNYDRHCVYVSILSLILELQVGKIMQKKEVVTTTLKLLREHDACADGYKTLVEFLGKGYPDDKSINLLTILESNGVRDCLWAFRATLGSHEKIAQLIAADCAESVLHFYTQKYPEDKRPENAIKTARDFANGLITRADAETAAEAASEATVAAAVYAADAADAADAAVYAANAADAAAYAAAVAAAYAAAYAASAAAAYAANAANAAAAYHKEREKQAEIIRKYLKF